MNTRSSIPYVPFTEAERAFITTRPYPTDREVLAKFPARSLDTIRKFRSRLGLPTSRTIERDRREAMISAQATDEPILITSVNQIDGPTAVEMMRSAEQINRMGPSDELGHATRAFPEMLPIGIAYMGDIHVGNGGVAFSAFEDDVDQIVRTDGLYLIGMGDYVDGVTGGTPKIGTALHAIGSIADRAVQNAAVTEVLKRAKDRFLAVVDGNHDAWSERGAAYNFTVDIANALDAPFFRQGGGDVELTVGAIEYLIAVAHDYEGKSRTNPSNKQRRMWADWPDRRAPDVVCTGHTHENLIHKESKKGSDPVFLNSGTYKERDTYSTDKRLRPSRGIPVVILYPDERRIVPFYGTDFDVALRTLATERAHYAALAQEAA